MTDKSCKGDVKDRVRQRNRRSDRESRERERRFQRQIERETMINTYIPRQTGLKERYTNVKTKKYKKMREG